MLVSIFAWYDAKRVGVDRDDLIDLSLYMLFAGLIGSRIQHVLADGYLMDYVHLCTDPLKVDVPSFIHVACKTDAECLAAEAGELCDPVGGHCHPARDCLAAFKFWQGGLAFYGGLILAIIVAIWFMRRRKMPMLKVMDLTSGPIALGLVFGRTGCILAGCCFGAIATTNPQFNVDERVMMTDNGPAFTFKGYVTAPFKDGSCKKNYDLVKTADGQTVCAFGRPAFMRHVKEGRLPLKSNHSLPVYPTQLYEAGFCLIIAAYLLLWRRKRLRFQGQSFWEMIALYGIGRFVVEFFRDDDRGLWFFSHLSTSQLIAIPMIAVGVVMWIRAKPKLEAAAVEAAAVEASDASDASANGAPDSAQSESATEASNAAPNDTPAP